mmetsp:Transcript_21344/g.34356  ORF Transcript_21344/g.34356 Transcript_21344/m.34356 type:complete len:83 (+) Transcript_21344:1526-1774(+)
MTSRTENLSKKRKIASLWHAAPTASWPALSQNFCTSSNSVVILNQRNPTRQPNQRRGDLPQSLESQSTIAVKATAFNLPRAR